MPPNPPTAAIFGLGTKGRRAPTFAVATLLATSCMTCGWAWSDLGAGVGEEDATALEGANPLIASIITSARTVCRIRCSNIWRGVRGSHCTRRARAGSSLLEYVSAGVETCRLAFGR